MHRWCDCWGPSWRPTTAKSFYPLSTYCEIDTLPSILHLRLLFSYPYFRKLRLWEVNDFPKVFPCLVSPWFAFSKEWSSCHAFHSVHKYRVPTMRGTVLGSYNPRTGWPRPWGMWKSYRHNKSPVFKVWWGSVKGLINSLWVEMGQQILPGGLMLEISLKRVKHILSCECITTFRPEDSREGIHLHLAFGLCLVKPDDTDQYCWMQPWGLESGESGFIPCFFSNPHVISGKFLTYICLGSCFC